MDDRYANGTYTTSYFESNGFSREYNETIEKLIQALKAIEAAVAEGTFEKFVTPVDVVFEDLPKMTVDVPGDRLLHNGNPLPEEHVYVFDAVALGTAGACQNAAVKDGTKVRIYSLDGNFTAIYSYCRKQREFKVVKMFL